MTKEDSNDVFPLFIFPVYQKIKNLDFHIYCLMLTKIYR